MLTSKQRAELRGKANSLEPIFQVGKNGLTPEFLAQLEGAIALRELMKIKILRETSPVDARTAADEIAAHLNADVVQVIGNIMVLYRENPELHKIEPKKTKTDPRKKPAVKKSRAFEKKEPAKKAQREEKSYSSDRGGRSNRQGRSGRGKK
ncbi:MAG: YhbY family RNA-binding protein [Ruminococcaceae bacterium]|nr:YhbY family RNA-binding protein [Oscillospiraceae bacterium]